MRVAAVAALAFNPVGVGSTTLAVLRAAAGLLLLVGLWTPIAGLAVVLVEGWLLWLRPPDPWAHILLATMAGALALLGPGAWSVDARLFGWKRIDIRDRQTP